MRGVAETGFSGALDASAVKMHLLLGPVELVMRLMEEVGIACTWLSRSRGTPPPPQLRTPATLP